MLFQFKSNEFESNKHEICFFSESFLIFRLLSVKGKGTDHHQYTCHPLINVIRLQSTYKSTTITLVIGYFV